MILGIFLTTLEDLHTTF
ncbi:hypothetical protein MXB_3277 [Myxobolus squamalis]|nr:hypothetical protein MXB_3277 [Myxobolus squamalis]